MMVVEVVSSLSGPLSEIISETIGVIFEFTLAAKNVLVKKDCFEKLANYSERIVPILRELNNKHSGDSESLSNVIGILNAEIRATKQFTLDCGKRSKLYLLMNSRVIATRLKNSTKEMNRALGLLPLASLDLSSTIFEEIDSLRDNMQRVEFRAAVSEGEILEKIELGIQQRNVDRMYANNLLVTIAEAVGISTEKSALKKEYEEFKNEIENARLRKDQAEAVHMDQIIALLDRADVASSPQEKEQEYLTKRKSLRYQPLEPLESFCCPITREVMVDPVETSSGHTFERSAIEKWLFSEGNMLCPLTKIPLDIAVLRPNKTLRQSIEEWKDRNNMITIASMKPKLMSEDRDLIINCLVQLRDLCVQRDMHREWILMENYIPILLRFLSEKNRDVRNHALVLLCILANDSDDAKDRISKVENAIEPIVRSLGRRVGEGKLAVKLLLELSESELMIDYIGKVKGCILYLVTMSRSDDAEAAMDARRLLKNLTFSDQNVIQMAKANYFEPLLLRLSQGSETAKRIMTTTLAEIELTDHNKESLVKGGVLSPLLHLVSHGDITVKMVALKALQNLSSLPKNGLQMVKEGAVRPLLDILFLRSSLSSSLWECVAATIMNLALSTTSQESGETPVLFLESDEDILRLFCLVNFMGPAAQQSIIQTFYSLCQNPSTPNIKTILIQSGTQVLIQLCENDNLHVRATAIQLFCCLTEDTDEVLVGDCVNQRYIETWLKIIQSSHDEDEVACAMGILSNLPETPQITQWILDAGALGVITSYLHNGIHGDHSKNKLIEYTCGALRRFTAPTNSEWQKRVAEAGIIPILVKLLESGTSLTKKLAAISLTRLSESSKKLSISIPKRKGVFCFSAPPESECIVHGGICTVKSSFCLVEAEAVWPLVRILEGTELGAYEASLDALLTLIQDEMLQNGCKVLTQANAIPLLIRFLSSSIPGLQEKSLKALERIFRQVEFKELYGRSAQIPLVDLTQRGNGAVKSLAAKILAHLNVLHDQSSYF